MSTLTNYGAGRRMFLKFFAGAGGLLGAGLMRPGTSEPEAEAAGGEGPIAVYDQVSLDGGRSFVEVVAIPPGCADEWPGAIDLEIATVQVRQVHRSEAIAGSQPRPLAVELYRERYGRTPVMRTWRAGDAPRCKLCAGCSAVDRPDLGGAVCLIGIPGPVSEADAPLMMDTGAPYRGEVDVPPARQAQA